MESGILGSFNKTVLGALLNGGVASEEWPHLSLVSILCTVCLSAPSKQATEDGGQACECDPVSRTAKKQLVKSLEHRSRSIRQSKQLFPFALPLHPLSRARRHRLGWVHAAMARRRPLLTKGGGSLWGCLGTRQPTHPPTHPDPPHRGGSMLLQSAGNTKTLCICPNPSGRSLHWQTGIALVQSPLPTDRDFCHFLPPFSQ